MSEKYLLTKEEERLLAELSESKILEVIEKLAKIEKEKAIDTLLSISIPSEAMRFWQGYAVGVEVLPNAIKDLHKEVFVNPENNQK